MKYCTVKLCIVLAAILTSAATGAEKDIHIPSGRSVGTSWTVTDGAGFRWDITNNGQVNDGTNDAYDGGMQLRVNGNSFENASSGRGSKDGREVEFGPWSIGTLKVWRRIYVDPKLGYCRWIDIFQNTSNTAQTATVQYFSNLGPSVNMTFTTSGGGSLTAKDWGIITAGSASSSSPALVHVFATRSVKLKPQFKFSHGSDNIYYNVPLKIPGARTVALCFFEAQRRPLAEAKKLLDNFRPEKELRKVPSGLRRLIVNMGSSTLIMEQIELPRHDDHDLAVLRNGDELLGTIRNDRIVVETFYGKLDLPAARILGLNVPTASDPHVQVVLADGQVVAGRFLNAPLTFKLTNGSEMALPLTKLQTASFRVSPEKPDRIAVKRPVAVLRSGQRLFFRRDDVDYTFHTEYGTVKLNPDHLRDILMDTPSGGLHRATFRNGSVLSGLLTTDSLRVALDLGPTLEIRRHLLGRLVLASGEPDANALSVMTLRNEDRLIGRIAAQSLTLKTRYGQFVAKPQEIARVEFQKDFFGRVQVKLHNGTSVTGRFVGQTARFRIEPGPELPVFIGHIVSIDSPAPPGKPTGKPKPAPEAPASTTRPASSRPATAPALPRPRKRRTEAEEARKLEAQLAALQARAASLQNVLAQKPDAEALLAGTITQVHQRIIQLQEELEKHRKQD